MAYEITGFSFSLPANVDLSSSQYTPVTVVTASGAGINTGVACAPVNASGDPIIGVLQNNPQLAEAATIMQSGISKVLSSAAITKGAKLAALTTGGVVTAASGNYVIGLALESASAANQYIAVLLVNLGKL